MRFSKLITSARLLQNWVNYGKVNTRLCCMPALPKQEDIGSKDECSNTVVTNNVYLLSTKCHL